MREEELVRWEAYATELQADDTEDRGSWAVSVREFVAAVREAREVARDILEWFAGMGMRPDWEARHPWLTTDQPASEAGEEEG